MNEKVRVFFGNETVLVDKGITFYEIKKLLSDKINFPVIGVKVNYEITSLTNVITKDSNVEFFGAKDIDGAKIYKSGLQFIFEVAIKELYKKNYHSSCEIFFNHSIGNGIHVTVEAEFPFAEPMIEELEAKINELINADLPIVKMNISKKDAFTFYQSIQDQEKQVNVHNVTNEIVTMYKIGEHLNYFYTEMPYSTGVINNYDLIYLGENRIGLMLSKEQALHDCNLYKNVISCFAENNQWLRKIGIPFVSNINKLVSDSKISDLMRVNEIRYEKSLADLVDEAIAKQAKYIMIAGPSSSGKTTTAKKISLLLKANGFEPLMMSTDDYFLDRQDTPKDENGNYNFECLEAMDLELLNRHLSDLKDGKEINAPVFDFITGTKSYNQAPLKLKDNGIIILEGLHCVNDALTPQIAKELKYKVYISPFMPLNIDRHNYISTTDLRMLRRMIRDNRKRGANVTDTIAYWQNVRRGEGKYIFPYMNQADKVINTSLVYELGVLKVYAEPLLYSVSLSSPYYGEARRLINFLKIFFTIPSEYVSSDSILREFIGGSIFE